VDLDVVEPKFSSTPAASWQCDSHTLTMMHMLFITSSCRHLPSRTLDGDIPARDVRTLELHIGELDVVEHEDQVDLPT